MIEDLDPYSRYFDRTQVAGLNRQTSGHFTGIGVVFARPVSAGRILFPVPDSPADRAGLRVGDRIVKVRDRPVADMRRGELQQEITRPTGRSVPLVVVGRDQVEREVLVELGEIVDPTVRHARVADGELEIGYLAITSFSARTPQEFDEAVDALVARGSKALVIDLRGNLGGVLRSAVEVANRFLPGGLVVSHESRASVKQYEAEPALVRFEGLPLALLVDEDSASASEVFAAALQEYRAAAVVGSPTYGKGVVQQVRAFGEGRIMIRLTTAYYYTPAHQNIERAVEGAWATGLTPDLVVPLEDPERESILEFLASRSPPEEALGELRAWEREESLELIPRPPPDAQLQAAVELFRGRRPGAYGTSPEE
jgi:carboxyl-terminal processing protease